MKRRINRILSDAEDDNPLSMLTNLFDIAMVFAVALMVAIVVHFNVSEIFSKEDYTIIKNPGNSDMEIITKKGNQVNLYRSSSENKSNGAKGKRVGTAYQLEDGNIIYIPE